MVVKPVKVITIAAKSASGAEPSKIISGSRKLLNCSASTKNTMTSEAPSTPTIVLPFAADLTRLARVVESVVGG
jgi:hypothetical protein